jgi:hypothetical protein
LRAEGVVLSVEGLGFRVEGLGLKTRPAVGDPDLFRKPSDPLLQSTPECWKGLPKVNFLLGSVVVKSHLRL